MTVFVEVLGCLGGSLSASSMVAQVVKTVRTQSLEDFSMLMLGLGWCASLLIFIYGILIGKPVVYITIAINLVCVSILVWCKLRKRSVYEAV